MIFDWIYINYSYFDIAAINFKWIMFIKTRVGSVSCVTFSDPLLVSKVLTSLGKLIKLIEVSICFTCSLVFKHLGIWLF